MMLHVWSPSLPYVCARSAHPQIGYILGCFSTPCTGPSRGSAKYLLALPFEGAQAAHNYFGTCPKSFPGHKEENSLMPGSQVGRMEGTPGHETPLVTKTGQWPCPALSESYLRGQM